MMPSTICDVIFLISEKSNPNSNIGNVKQKYCVLRELYDGAMLCKVLGGHKQNFSSQNEISVLFVLVFSPSEE